MWFKRCFLLELKLYETDWSYGAEIGSASSGSNNSRSGVVLPLEGALSHSEQKV